MGEREERLEALCQSDGCINYTPIKTFDMVLPTCLRKEEANSTYKLTVNQRETQSLYYMTIT